MKSIKFWQILLGLSIAGGGLWFFFRNVDIGELLAELRATDVRAIAASIVLVVLAVYIRSIRWYSILGPAHATSRHGFFSFTLIGYMLNNIIPARLGEAARALLLWKHKGIGPVTAIGSLLMERALDLWSFGSFFVVPVLFSPNLRQFRRPAALIAGFLAGSALCGLFYAIAPRFFARVAAQGLFLVPRRYRDFANRTGRKLASNCSWLYTPKRLFAIVFLTYAMNFTYVLVILVLTGFSSGFGVLDALFSQSVAAMSAVIPSPGFIGSMHAILFKGLTILGMDDARARAVTLLYHAIHYVPITLAGLYYFFSIDMSIHDISGAREQFKGEETRCADTTINEQR